MSCQLDDIGCTKDEHNFRRQSWNPHLKGRALEMHVSGVGPSTIPSDPGCFLCDAPLATWPTTKVAEIAPRAIKVSWYWQTCCIRLRDYIFSVANGTGRQGSTLNDCTMSPGKGEMAALPCAGHSANFSISGRHPAVFQGRSACSKSPTA